MGSLFDYQLRQPPPSPLSPRPVSAVALEGDTSATPLVEKKPSHWQYADFDDELPVKVKLTELESIPIPGGGDYLFWSGIEVRVLREKLPDFGEPGRNYHIASALYPASFMWYFNAPLRPGLDKNKFPDWQDRLARLATGEIHISQLPFDPFETDPGWLFARLGDPLRPHWRQDTRELGDGALIGRDRTHRPRRAGSREGDSTAADLPRKWFFGLCPDLPDNIAYALYQRNQEFQDLAASGALPLRHRGRARQSERQIGNRREGDGLDLAERRQMGTQAGTDSPDQEQSDVLLRGAVAQALAGRDNPYISVNGQIRWRFFRNSYRDMAQRLATLYNRLNREERKRRHDAAGAGPEADAEEREPLLSDLLASYPELVELAPNGILDIGMLKELFHKSPEDPRLAALHQFLHDRRRGQE